MEVAEEIIGGGPGDLSGLDALVSPAWLILQRLEDLRRGQERLEGEATSSRQEIASLRQDIETKLNGLRQETVAEIASVCQEMGSEFKSVRQEMGAEFASVRQEMGSEFKVVRQEISGLTRWMIGIIVTVILAAGAIFLKP